MAKKDELRFRVQRFLTGPFSVNDLNAVFLFLREYSFGRQSVRDLGDMIAHADIRNKGVSVNRVRDMQTVALYKLRPLVDNSAVELNLNSAPPKLLAVMDATFNLLDEITLHRETGLSKSQIGAALAKIKRKFSVKDDGNIFWNSHPPSNKEKSIIICLTRFLISRCAYSADELVEDTLYVLIKNGFMGPEQSELFYTKRNHLLIFAVASIHGVLFDCRDGVAAQAEAGWTTVGDDTYLNVSVTFPVSENPELKIGLALFDTDLHPALFCEDFEQDKRHATFAHPLEITEEGKLRSML